MRKFWIVTLNEGLEIEADFYQVQKCGTLTLSRFRDDGPCCSFADGQWLSVCVVERKEEQEG